MTISTAIDPQAVARVLGIKTEFKDFRTGSLRILPQRLAVIGQGNGNAVYSTDKRDFNTAFEVGQVYGFGSPLHLAALQLFPVNNNGVGLVPVTFFPLDAGGGAVQASGTITPAGAVTKAGQYLIRINNMLTAPFVIAEGASIADMTLAITEAINSVVELPVTATDNGTDVTVTAKWAGITGNDIVIEAISPADTGVTITVTTMAGGLVEPDVQPALDQFGDIWYTMVLNLLTSSEETNLDKYQTFGVGRWGPTVKKPLVVFTGNTAVTVDDATLITDTRKDDFINSQLVAPGSNDLPFVVAARQVTKIITLANSNPAHDYGSQEATGLTPGADADQWLYNDRDLAVKRGSSTIEVRDGVINISDTVTHYHPDGDPLPAYRYVVDIVKLQNIIFNIELVFATPEWDGAPLVPDFQVVSNRTAKKPKMAKAEVATVLDELGLEAIISDPETAKLNILAGINTTNPKRLDLCVPIQLSGNTNIISVDLKFGFFFGTAQVA